MINEEVEETKQLFEHLKETCSDEEAEMILKLVKYYNNKYYNNEYDLNKFDDNHIQLLKLTLHFTIQTSLKDCIK